MLFDAMLKCLPERVLRGHISCLSMEPAGERLAYPELGWSTRLAQVPRRGLAGRVLQVYSLLTLTFMSLSQHFRFLRHVLLPQDRRSFDLIDGCDIAISCPGGYLEDSNFSYYVALLNIAVANRYAKANILAPQSVGPIRSRFGRLICRVVLRTADMVFVRESASFEFVARILSLRNIILTGDLAFLFGKPDETAFELADRALVDIGVKSDQPIFGLTVVDWHFPGHRQAHQARSAYISCLERLIRFAQSKGYQAVVFNQVSSDLELSSALRARNRDLVIDAYERSPVELQAMIAKCGVFFGTRFHSCIFALLNGQPLGAISYLPKTSGIMADLKLDDWVFDIEALNWHDLRTHFLYLENCNSSGGNRSKRAVDDYVARLGPFERYLQQLTAEAPHSPREISWEL